MKTLSQTGSETCLVLPLPDSRTPSPRVALAGSRGPRGEVYHVLHTRHVSTCRHTCTVQVLCPRGPHGALPSAPGRATQMAPSTQLLPTALRLLFPGPSSKSRARREEAREGPPQLPCSARRAVTGRAPALSAPSATWAGPRQGRHLRPPGLCTSSSCSLGCPSCLTSLLTPVPSDSGPPLPFAGLVPSTSF